MAALLSGEMKDTVQMNPAGAYGMSIIVVPRPTRSLTVSYLSVLERFFSMKERQKLFRSWAGAASMWIKVRCIVLIVPPYYQRATITSQRVVPLFGVTRRVPLMTWPTPRFLMAKSSLSGICCNRTLKMLTMMSRI